MNSFRRFVKSSPGAVSLIAMLWATPAPAAEPVKVFILAGQSNMEGKAQVALLERQIKQPENRERFAHLHRDGEWVVRDDVWIKFLDRQGKLTVGFGSPGRIGPELAFGNVVGDHYDAPVLLIKTAWGGKSLYRDFRPPSSGLPTPDILQALLENQQKRNAGATAEEVKESFGAYYRAMLAEIAETLKQPDRHFPALQGREFELAGLVWFQGWNDMINTDYTAEYTQHMANFIRDVRKDLNAPRLPIVVGVLGVGGEHEERPNPKREAFQKAQAAVGDAPEFQDNVKVVSTAPYWDQAADAVFKKGWKENLEEWNQVGSDYPYHYLGSVKTYSQIGEAFGRAMLELCAKGEPASAR